MGYVAGFRLQFRQYYSLGLTLNPARIGNCHNAYVQVLADAGWLALAVYLIMLAKIVWLAWRLANQRRYLEFAPDKASHSAIECSVLMFIFALIGEMSSADADIPLRASFYWQNIIVAIILGISTNMLTASRSRRFPSSK
jgi:O-antigen ligase